MIKYYTRACNFFYGSKAKSLINKNKALPLCGNKNIAFNNIEIITRNKKKVYKENIKIDKIKQISKLKKKIIVEQLNNITKKRKNFLKGLDFSKPIIMGILNLTPDSFSDGGKFNNKKKSLNHISHMINSGAKIIDVGGESTRPGSREVNPKIEWKRVKYVLRNFKRKYKKTCLSIDTRKSDVMLSSVNYGADLINDVSGFSYDKNAIKKTKKLKVSKVIHHMRGEPNNMQIAPKYNNVLLDIYDFFENKIKELKDKRLILDPGIGFGKNLKHNLTLISNISLFHSLGFPILVGTSRKRFINQIVGKYDSKDRTGGTLASVNFLLSQGVQIFRVHNVKEVKQSVLVFEKILFN